MQFSGSVLKLEVVPGGAGSTGAPWQCAAWGGWASPKHGHQWEQGLGARSRWKRPFEFPVLAEPHASNPMVTALAGCRMTNRSHIWSARCSD